MNITDFIFQAVKKREGVNQNPIIDVDQDCHEVRVRG